MIPASAAHSRTALAPTLAGVSSLAVGILVLIGWAIDNTILKSLIPGFITMKPNAALAFMLCGLALLLLREKTRAAQRISAACASAVAAFGVITILEYLLAWRSGFDEWLFKDQRGTSMVEFPGRMGINTAWCFFLVGTAMLADRGTDDKNLSWREGLTLGALFTACIALLGYLYQEKSLYEIGHYTPMALHTALTMLVVGAGILFLRPDHGLMAIITSEQAGGQMLRRLLPGILLALPAVGWIRLVGERQGLYDTELGLAIFTALAIVAFLSLLVWTAHSLNHASRVRDLARHSRDKSDQRFRQLAESIREVFWLSDPAKQQVLYVSPGYESVWGRSCESLYASPRSWAEAIHPDDRDRIWQAATTKQAAGTYDEQYRIVRPDGSIRWIHDRAFPVLESRGHVVRVAGVADDITTRKQTELALRDSEERFEKAFRSSPHPVGITELETGVCVDANNACLTLFGFDREEVIGRSTLDLQIWPRREDRARLVRHLREHGSLQNKEIALRTKQGETRQFLFSSELIELKGVPCIVTVGNDITERKQMEQALKLTQLCVDSTEDSVFFTRPDARFAYANDAACRRLGYSREELTSMTVHDIDPGYPPDDWPTHWEELRTRKSLAIETCHRTKGGRIVPVEMSIAHTSFDGEEYACAIARDSTERKRAEQVLRQAHDELEARVLARTQELTEANRVLREREEQLNKSETFLSSILEHLPNMVFVKEAQGLRFVRMNTAGETLVGCPREALLGKNDHDFFPKHQADFSTAKDREVLQGGRLVDIPEEPIQTTDRGLRIVHTKKIPLLDNAGNPQYLLGISEDITERKQAEDALRSAYAQLRDLAHRLEAAKEAERQRIARELHDEFGQALTGLKLDLSWLGAQLTRITTFRARPSLIKKTEAMSAAVDALIDAVRETATSLRPSMLDDLGLIPALEWLVKQFREKTKIDCRLETAPEIEQVQMTADSSTALFRLAQEMLTNVARHAHAANVRLHLSHTVGSLILECTDDGEGILAHRISRSTSLGLRGMEERAAMLGGSFIITGAPGVGTTATVSLPLSSVQIPAMEDRL